MTDKNQNQSQVHNHSYHITDDIKHCFDNVVKRPHRQCTQNRIKTVSEIANLYQYAYI